MKRDPKKARPAGLADFKAPTVAIEPVSDGRFTAKLVESAEEYLSVLDLRYEVFRREIGGDTAPRGFEQDEFDHLCEHLIVVENESGRAVGTYRLCTIESAGGPDGFYASGEFDLNGLPKAILENAVELGRACIRKEHRNSRVLFLMWKVLAQYIVVKKKQFLFGCCSVFSTDPVAAGAILRQLRDSGHTHDSIDLRPLPANRIIQEGKLPSLPADLELPSLLKIYLRIGCRICGEPAVDREMGTLDYFALFDLDEIDPRYRKMFFS